MSKRVLKSVLCLLIAVWVVSVVSPSVFAQLPPPISPWMSMFDRPRSDLGSYLGNVKPQQDMMRAYANQASQMQAQQRALQALQSGGGSSGGGSGAGARDLANAGAGGSSGGNMLLLAPKEIPSTQRNPAGFNQYLHYYPSAGLPRRPVPNFSTTGRRR